MGRWEQTLREELQLQVKERFLLTVLKAKLGPPLSCHCLDGTVLGHRSAGY